jgi:hypothetical protein
LVEHGLLDDVVGPEQERLRDRQAERLRGLQVDDQLELCGLFDGEIGRFGALEDLVDVGRDPLELLIKIIPVGHEPALIRPVPCRVHSREAILRRQIKDLSRTGDQNGVSWNDKAVDALLGDADKKPVEIIFGP